ncbi:DNA topoisomerase 3 [Mucilaginibacter phyllosphaerae]|uniref:DNA topoisomerase n=1 Tax=Mucilaginibacter phyllosphaerae TaxID=1812349 RepID=A0A4Y8AJP4_9SPHI|nr:DNA topoisomerase 3 [Mucilaginibacter phyllosphaerae]MBB3967699.1 DNA topoisomerase-3 [Mucilaginibacter phyllosphaerae]TEW69246.1 DNA topoisomerase III [Mucilaginibacter phyllosphaerae]GGH03909.1 DNA topoisomerase [Mucilaginibacter phyllosphaerae]
MKVIIAEKPSVGREIAKVFGASTKKDGYIEGKGYTFTWAFGHLLQLAAPQEYGYYGWNVQNLPMLPQKFKLAIRKVKTKDGMVDDPGVRKQLEIIKALFDEATEIIVATDAGREGELIFRYIYYYLKCKKPFKRLWISSQTDAAIKDGFRNLKPGTDYDTLFNSAHCRSQSDWLVGMNATQALSLSSGTRSVLSLGRVQTPTLAMICTRYLENKNFVPQTYYQVSIQPDKNGQVFKAISEKNFKTREEAQAVLDRVEATGLIESVEAKPRKEPPPLLHDLSSLQQEANKRKGFTADQTLTLLQNLYESKLVTYPRTGSRYIGDDVFAQVPGLIEKFTSHDDFGKQATILTGAKLNRRSVNAKKVTDHHAILPTGERPYQLSADHQAIYDMIAGRMLEAFHQDCIKEITKIIMLSGSRFVASGTVIQTAGWRAVFNDKDDEKKDEENATLPKVVQGENLPITDKALLEKQTKPKPLYNEATLLKALETAGKEIDDEELRQAMKDSGLGTPATRAAMIETLLKRNYIAREKKNLVPTETGLSVYHVVKDHRIAQAELTGAWEKRLEEIRSGASVNQFQEEIKTYTRDITRELLTAGKGMVIK